MNDRTIFRVVAVLVVFVISFFIVPSFADAQLQPEPVVLSAHAQTGTCGTTYTIQSGDTLTQIALRCGVLYADLRAANPTITNPDLIFPGQVINMPGSSGPGIPPTGGTTYTVVSGDRLFRIALRFNTTVAAIQAANPFITNPNLIYPGQILTIPAADGGPGIPPTGGTTYTVLSGDTLSGIAARFAVTLQSILNANTWITNPDLIFPGWVIQIP